MGNSSTYEVVESTTGWTLRRADRTPLVEFPTQHEAVRAGLAVCRDEGLGRLYVRLADGSVTEMDPLAV